MSGSARNDAIRKVKAHLEVIRLRRPPNMSTWADSILARAVEIYGVRPLAPAEIQSRCNALERALSSEIPDVIVRRAHKKSLSRDKNAQGLMVLEPRPFEVGNRTFVGLFCHTVMVKPSAIWLLSSIEPGGTQAHLYERIIERTDLAQLHITETQERLSDIWPSLLWMRSKRLQAGRGFIPHDFFTPWNEGLLFGSIQKLTSFKNAAPLLAVVTKNGTEQRYLPDTYAEGGNRIWAFTSTFVDSEKLKPHQILIRDRLVHFISKHHDAIDHFKRLWMIAEGDGSPFVSEIMKVFRYERTMPDRINAALSDMEEIVDSDEWQSEAELSLKSRERRRASAVTKSAASKRDQS